MLFAVVTPAVLRAAISVTVNPTNVSLSSANPGTTPKSVNLTAKSDTAGVTLAWAPLNPPSLGTLTPDPVDPSKAVYVAPTHASGYISAVVLAKVTATKGTESAEATATIYLGPPAAPGGIYSRFILGGEMSGASAAPRTFKYFVDLYNSVPLGNSNPDGFGPRLRAWVDTRISSVPQSGSTTLLDFLGGSNPTINKFTDLKVNEVAQAIETMGGLQYRLWAQSEPRKMFFEDGRSRTTLHLVAAYGAVTPIDPKDTAAFFSYPVAGSPAADQLKQRYGLTGTGKNTLVITTLDRDRFLRQYYGGIRLNTHYYNDAGQPTRRPIRSVDILFGQNEAVTGGRWRGTVGRADFFLPIATGDGTGFVYVFGSAAFKLSRRAFEREPLILDPTTAPAKINAADVQLLPLGTGNRDTFKIGVGVDLLRLFAKLKKANAVTP